MHFYPFHVGDYIQSTVHLTNEEDIAYRRLLDLYYTTEQPIPTDTSRLAKRLRVSQEAIDYILTEFFHKTESGWTNERCDQELSVYRSMQEGGRKGAASRWGNRQPNDTANKGANGGAIGEAIAPVMPTKNQEPRTINQEPISNAVALAPAVQTKAPKVGFDYEAGHWVALRENTAIVDTWLKAYPAVDLREEFNKMRAWLMSNKKNRKVNLERFINNWLSKAQDQAKNPNTKSFAERKQEFLDKQAAGFYAPLMELTPEERKAWGFR